MEKVIVAAAVAIVGTFVISTITAEAADNNQHLQFTCKNVYVKLPSGFGAGVWRLSPDFKYPSMSMAQLQYLASSRMGAECKGSRPVTDGYLVGTFHFSIHGVVTARLIMSGCAPNGQRVYINTPVTIPTDESIHLDKESVDVRGRCG